MCLTAIWVHALAGMEDSRDRAMAPALKRKHESSLQGAKINMVQIGLGNNRTFIQNLAGRREEWSSHMHWLMQSCSRSSADGFTGVAVEPVREHADAAEITASMHLPGVRVMQVAIGQSENEKGCIHVLRHDAELETDVRDGMKEQLEYLRNMSCLGGPHPDFEVCAKYISETYGVLVEMVPREVKVLSWKTLVERVGFRGAEVLMIDAEGSDAGILRSMLQHCEECAEELPDLIQFESLGHCDRLERGCVEKEVIGRLEKAAYIIVARSWQDTYAVKESVMKEREEVIKWLQSWRCSSCGSTDQYPYEMTGYDLVCGACSVSKIGRVQRDGDVNDTVGGMPKYSNTELH